MTAKILCIGHTTYDTFLFIDRADVYCDIDRHMCAVRFGFGDKIPVEKVLYSTGGGAANISVGLSRLGLTPSLYTYIGKDVHGKFVKAELRRHGIKLDMVVEDDVPTDLSTIVSYDIDRTIFTYNHDRRFDYPKGLDDFDIVFVSSVGKDVSNIYDSVIAYKKMHPKSLVVFSPGSKELADSLVDVQNFAKHVDIFIGNVEEGLCVFNPKLERSDVVLKDFILALQSILNSSVVLTDGPKGVYIGENGEFHHLESVPMKVVEKTGAGDAFASGFLGGKVYGISTIDAVKWGIVNSISMIQTYGAHEGLLDRKQILSDVSRYWPEV